MDDIHMVRTVILMKRKTAGGLALYKYIIGLLIKTNVNRHRNKVHKHLCIYERQHSMEFKSMDSWELRFPPISQPFH